MPCLRETACRGKRSLVLVVRQFPTLRDFPPHYPREAGRRKWIFGSRCWLWGPVVAVLLFRLHAFALRLNF